MHLSNHDFNSKEVIAFGGLLFDLDYNLIEESSLLSTTSHISSDWIKYTVNQKVDNFQTAIKLKPLNQLKRIDQTSIWAGYDWDSNFQHLLVETLPRLQSIYDVIPQQQSITVFANTKCNISSGLLSKLHPGKVDVIELQSF